MEKDYNTLYEVDDFAWYQGGRNLYDATDLTTGNHDYTLKASASKGTVTVVVSANNATSVAVSVNDKNVGDILISARGNYDAMRTARKTFDVDNLAATNKIRIHNNNSAATMRLDYISLYSEKPASSPDLSSGSFPVPEYVGSIANQDHHADEAVDMVIIIPSNKKLEKQAYRLKTIHEANDSSRIRIIPANELFNEFSSGTPDANAYRRYLKMLYVEDRDTRQFPALL